MSDSLELLSPCKLNLFLHITGRRADGYHELQTVFQLLNYGDTMTFKTNNSGEIVIEPALPGVALTDNLIFKAAQQLKEHTGCQKGASIQINKTLPMGGGLGGGSSNAATTLLALNYLWQTGLKLEELAEIGLHLGADVPVFIKGRSAWAEGVGERLETLDLPSKTFLVLKPDCEVSTAEIFSNPELTRNTSPIRIPAFLKQGGRNDCESTVRQLYSQVDRALNWLNQFSAAQLTGTGACIFASFDSPEQANEILAKLPEAGENLTGFVATGINVSPVHQQLQIPT